MSLATPTRVPPVVPTGDPDPISADVGPLFRLSVEQYHGIAAAGVLQDGDPVELLEGLLVQKMTKYPPHSGTVMRLRASIEPLLPPNRRYRSQEPITLLDGEPEPDGVVAVGTADDNFRSHPSASETLLVIEVSDSTLPRDRGVKLRSYARSGIPCYWIVNLIDRQIEIFTNPDPAAVPQPTYRRRELYAGDDRVPLTLDGSPLATFAAADLLPPQ